MPVSVGKSYVSEAAYSYAQSRMAGESKAGGKSGDVLKSLADEFGDTKFSVGSAPFSGTGTRNISIAPNILQQMAEDPEKRMEYEALIYDCNDFQKNRPQSIGGRKIKASGFIIDKDGGLRSWSISESDGGDRKPEASGRRTVTFNGAKMARMIAAAQNSSDIKTVMNLLQIDLKQCEDGLRDGACDEAEVEKVRAMMDEAQKRKAELAGVEDDSKGFDQFSISMLI